MYYNDHDINYVVRSNEQWEWLMKYLGSMGNEWQSGKLPSDKSTNYFKTSSFNPLYVVLDERFNTITWGHSPELYNFNQEEVSELMREESEQDLEAVTDSFNEIVREIMERNLSNVVTDPFEELLSFEEESVPFGDKTIPFDEVLDVLEIDLEGTFVFVNMKEGLYGEIVEYSFQADDFELDREFGRYNIIDNEKVIASVAEEYVAEIKLVEFENDYGTSFDGYFEEGY